MLKAAIRWAVRTPAFSAFVGLMEAVDKGRDGLLHILTYHRVDDPERCPDLFPGLIGAAPEEFDLQMGLLTRTSRVVSLADVMASLDGGPTLPSKAVLITFDDAYEDFALHAWPILRKHGLSATLFVPTAYPGQPERAFWWDRLHQAIREAPPGRALETRAGRLPLTSRDERARAFRALVRHIKALTHEESLDEVERVCRDLGSSGPRGRVLGWQALRELAAQGVVLAPHSRTHPLMNRMPLDAAVDEAVGSLRDLEREVGPVPPCFAYPGGAFDEDLPPRLARAGFRLALTSCRGVNDFPSADPLRLRRIHVGRTHSPALLRLQLLPGMRITNRFVPISGSP
jgi:peptidoglycan/xylan/chitin deacetylase (PgdA/CDA1 family)